MTASAKGLAHLVPRLQIAHAPAVRHQVDALRRILGVHDLSGSRCIEEGGQFLARPLHTQLWLCLPRNERPCAHWSCCARSTPPWLVIPATYSQRESATCGRPHVRAAKDALVEFSNCHQQLGS